MPVLIRGHQGFGYPTHFSILQQAGAHQPPRLAKVPDDL